MHVTVAIVSFRNPADIVRCLAALARSDYVDFDVVICENGGAAAYDALGSILPQHLPGGQPVRAILASGNLGYAGGVNICLEASPQSGAVWVLNPDTEPRSDALRAQVVRLEAGDCDAVGGIVQLPNGVIQSYGGVWRPMLARAISIGHGSPSSAPVDPADIERRQSYLNGASMMIGRSFLDTVGPMREDYFLYCEEVDWCLRGLAQGMRLGFAPDAVVLHHQGTTTGNEREVRNKRRAPVYLNERNKIILTRDLYPRLLAPAAATALMGIFLRYGRRMAWRQLGYALAGWSAGLRDERGAPSWFPG